MRVSLWLAAALAAAPLLGVTSAAAADHVSAAITAAVADSDRPPADTARDGERKPAETLAFAGIKRGQRIAEIWPGGGYFTRILSVTIGSKGHLYALTPPKRANAPPGRPGPAAAVTALAAQAHYHNISVMPLDMSAPMLGLKRHVDVVWTSDNYHDFHNIPNLDLAAFNKNVFSALKPGGIYIIVDHAAAAGHGASDTHTLHRIDPETVKAEVTAAGFKFAGRSDALHNPDDPHTQPIFDAAIRGKTDQFILKFVKP